MAMHRRLAAKAATACLVLFPAICGAQALNVPAAAQARAMGVIVDKANRNIAERKVEDQLLSAHRAFSQGARRNLTVPGVPALVQGSVDQLVAADQTTRISIRVDGVTKGLANWLQAQGARDVAEYGQTVVATIAFGSLLDIAARPEVLRVGQLHEGATSVYSATGPKQAVAGANSAVPNTGAVAWKGVTAQKVDLVQSSGIVGSNAKVCVLADGVDSLTAKQLAGELGSVQVLGGQSGSGDAGTAMLEIIADMAPGATLGFATAKGGADAFAANIRALRTSMVCDIIVDGHFYPEMAAFSDDVVAQAVNDVTAAGAVYITAAGNGGNLDHGHSGVFEGDFNPSGTPMPAIIGALESGQGTLHQFPTGAFTTFAGSTPADRSSKVTLKWSDLYNFSDNDYDIFVLDSTGTNAIAWSRNGQQGPGYTPYEEVSCRINGPGPCDLDASNVCDAATGANCFFPFGARIYVVLYAGALRAIRVDTHGGKLAAGDGTARAAFGHSAAATAVTVGAVTLAQASGSNPFTSSAVVNSYSSDGQRRMFFDATQNPITPGNFLFGTNGGATVQKVDLAGGDCGATSTAGYTTFCGTAAAAAGAAGIAALVKSGKPTLTNTQIATALRASGLDIETVGTDRNAGTGILMAGAALANSLTPLTYGKSYTPSTIMAGDISTLRITVTNSNAVNLTGISVTDTYPTGIVTAPAPGTSTSGAGCTGTLAATAGGSTFTVSNATVPAGVTCTYSVLVTVPDPGSYADNSSNGSVTTLFGMTTTSGAATLTALTPTQRAFISSQGNDANTASLCGFASPCRNLQAAQSVLAQGGEIIALDAAGYGAITITKSMSIIANPGFYAGIAAPTGDAVTIATPGVKVLIRGFTINGTGGVNGINMTAGTSLTVENSVVSNFAGTGIKVDAPGANVRLAGSVLLSNLVDGLQVLQGRADVVRSRAIANGRHGFAAMTGASGTTATLSVIDSFASGNQNGFVALANGTGSTVRFNATRVTGASNTGNGLLVQATSGTPSAIVGSSMFSQNGIGLNNTGGTLRSLGTNLVDLNGTTSTGTITTVPGL